MITVSCSVSLISAKQPRYLKALNSQLQNKWATRETLKVLDTFWLYDYIKQNIIHIFDCIQWRQKVVNLILLTSLHLRGWRWAEGSGSKCDRPCRIRHTAAVCQDPAWCHSYGSYTTDSSSWDHPYSACTQAHLILENTDISLYYVPFYYKAFERDLVERWGLKLLTILMAAFTKVNI